MDIFYSWLNCSAKFIQISVGLPRCKQGIRFNQCIISPENWNKYTSRIYHSISKLSIATCLYYVTLMIRVSIGLYIRTQTYCQLHFLSHKPVVIFVISHQVHSLVVCSSTHCVHRVTGLFYTICNVEKMCKLCILSI